MSKKKLYFVLSTHWDREWYQSFQDYRYRLVDLLDEVLDGIRSGELKGPFYSDGQVCLLEDYLEINPQRSEEVKGLVKEGRIAAGPWYVLPDEFLVSAEAMVRNIRLGFETARSFGAEPSRTGFLCDMFGHISQMPQILNNFGINNAFIWRGINVDKRHILWKGADGSEVCTFIFGDGGYGSYAQYVREARELYQEISPQRFKQCLEDFLKNELDKTEIDPILLFDGLDHQCWDRQAYQQLFEIINDDSRFDIIHTSLDDYARAMEKDFSKVKETVTGQLRYVADDWKKQDDWLITGVVSSRADLKQSNAYCQDALCRWAEPFSAISSLCAGKKYPKGFLDTAWKWLIKNHPHDSICGCSIDQVHKDMEFRFDQVRLIADRLTTESLKTIAIENALEINDDELKVVVFNPLPKAIDEVVDLELKIPEEWNSFQEVFGFEKKPGFIITDETGSEINYQRLSQSPHRQNLVTFRTKVPTVYETDNVGVALKLAIEPLGYKSLIIKQTPQAKPVRHPDSSLIASSDGRFMENEFLKVGVNAAGTLNLLDKRNGQKYENLLIFEDTADIGDGWYYGGAVNDELYSSYAADTQVSVVSNGPEMATLKATVKMKLPAAFDFNRMRRSSEPADFVVTTFITLRKGAETLEFESFVDNNVCDHRLRVSFPSQTSAETYLADSLFDVIEEPISLPEDNYKKRELEIDAKPQYSWSSVADDKRGLAVVSTGQYESAVADEADKPLKLTLFRSTGRTVMTDGEPGGQLLKPLSFKYRLMPLLSGFDRLKIYNEAAKLAGGIKTSQLRKEDIIGAKAEKPLPASTGFIGLEGAVLSSFSTQKDCCELRFFNPANEASKVEINLLSSLKESFSEAYKADFDFNKTQQLRISDGKIALEAAAKEVVTVILTGEKVLNLKSNN